MNSTYPVTKPTPQQVRAWMVQRRTEKVAPPTPEQIRRELGWGLVATNFKR